MDFNEFCKYIRSLDDDTSIGIHGINKSRSNEKSENIVNNIMNNGLIISGWGGLLSTVKMFGKVKDLSDYDLKRIYDYVWNIEDNDEIINILFGFPEVITNSNGEEFYLGHFDKLNSSEYAKGNKEAGSDLPLNILFDNIKMIPNDFIIGCIKSKVNSDLYQFIANNNYYEFKDNTLFYDNLFRLLQEKNIINIVDWYDNLDLAIKYGINIDLIKNQYEEYLLNKKTK